MFEGVLQYVSVASILVDVLPPTHGGSTQNVALFGQAVLEKMFEHCGWTTYDERLMDAGA